MIESVTELPFNRHVGIQKGTTGDCLLEIPAGERYLNHIGTVHAGAQLALAEACSGEYLLQAFSDAPEFVPVVRRVEAKFKKPANGRITANVKMPVPSIEDTQRELNAKGRCLITIGVDVFDEHGAHSLTSNFEWFLVRSKD